MQRKSFCFATTAIGSRRYLEFAVDMALSLRRFHSDPICVLCTPELAAIARAKYTIVFDEIFEFNEPLISLSVSKFFLAKYVPYERVMFLDADILVQSDLTLYLDDASAKPLALMGRYIARGTPQRHHQIKIDALLRHFDLDFFFTSHSSVLIYERSAALPFMADALSYYEKVYTRRWRLRGFVGDEIAIGLAAHAHDVQQMAHPFPVIWPAEMNRLRPGQRPKPLLHFIAKLPSDTLQAHMAEIIQRRDAIGLPNISTQHWSVKSQTHSRREKFANRFFKRRKQLEETLNSKVTALQRYIAPTSPLHASPADPNSRVIRFLDAHANTKPAPKKIFHHHLMKCGGTSLNHWLDAHFPAYPDNFVSIQKSHFDGYLDEPNVALRDKQRLRGFTEEIMRERDMLHDHGGFARYVPAQTQRVTLLRDPRLRLISQYKDWRTLEEDSIAGAGPKIRHVFKACQSLPLKQFLEDYALTVDPAYHFMNNYMVRAIAMNRIGFLAQAHCDAKDMLPIAMDVLAEDFELVGVLGDEMAFRAALSHEMGWCPPSALPHANPRNFDSTEDANRFGNDLKECAQIIEKLTCHDQRLYAFAQELSGQKKPPKFDQAQAAFEAGSDDNVLNTLQPKARSNGVAYDMSGPICARGFVSRRQVNDGFGLTLDASQSFKLYFKVPQGTGITAYIRISNADINLLRKAVNLSIDGIRVPPEFAHAGENVVDVYASCQPAREFIELELDLKISAAPLPTTAYDSLLVHQYGWQFDT